VRSSLTGSKGSRVVTVPYWTKTAGDVPLRSSRLARGLREPEARRAHRAERNGDQEGHPIAPGEVVDGAAEPGPEGAAETVADAEDAVDDTEAPPLEELGGHRGDDRAAGAEAEAEQEGIGVERRRMPPRLEPQQAQGSRRRAGVGEGRRRRAPDPIGGDAEEDPARGRHEAGEAEDPRHEQAR